MAKIKKTLQDYELCKYNQEVNCECRECKKCGWNPDVEKERKKEILEN